MSLIVIVGQLDIHPQDSSTAAELMLVMMNETAKERGCHHYAFSRDLSAPDRFQLSELWEDDAALAAHFRTDHMAAYREGMGKLRVESRTVTRYVVATSAAL